MPCRGSCGSRPNTRSESSASWLSRQMWGWRHPMLMRSGRSGIGPSRWTLPPAGRCATGSFGARDDGYCSWVEFFFDQQLPELHSTKQYEDTVGWALETNAEAMIAEREGRAAPSGRAAEELCDRARCPVLVIHGSDDRCQPLARGRRLAELTSGEIIVLEGAGHLPHGRDPVTVLRLITEFVDRITGAPMRTTTWTRGASRAK